MLSIIKSILLWGKPMPKPSKWEGSSRRGSDMMKRYNHGNVFKTTAS